MQGAANRHCAGRGVPPPLTITNGVVRSQRGGRWEGSVSPQGVLVMRDANSMRVDGQIDSQGIITAQFGGWICVATFVWRKQFSQGALALTTAFDGEYIGVSRESSKTASAPGAECPPNSVPAPLTITNGVVLGWWEGTVSPQGALVIRNPKFTRVDAQIDPVGTVKGQYGSSACTVTFVWRKQPG